MHSYHKHRASQVIIVALVGFMVSHRVVAQFEVGSEYGPMSSQIKNMHSLLTTLTVHSDDLGGFYAETLAELKQGASDPAALDSLMHWKTDADQFLPMLYLSGLADTATDNTPIIASPVLVDGKRAVGYINGSVRWVGEETWKDELAKARQAHPKSKLLPENEGATNESVSSHGYVIYSSKTAETTIANGELCTLRSSPFSTYKIPHTLLALEINPTAATLKRYDATRHPAQDWWPSNWTQDHELRSAFQNSVVWSYQDLASTLDLTEVTKHLQRWQYGNASTKGGQTEYWLGQGLAISAHEQVRFLRKLHEGKLGLSAETTNKFKDVAFVEEHQGKHLYAKTGTGQQGDRWIAWYVGWMEGAADDVSYLALICLESSFDAARTTRKEVINTVFKQIGFR